jgi:hypothetical protein
LESVVVGVISVAEELGPVLKPDDPRGTRDAVELGSGYGTDDEGKVGSGGVMILSLVCAVVPATVDELPTGRPEAVVDGDVDVRLVGVMERLNGAGPPGVEYSDEAVALAGAVDAYGVLLIPLRETAPLVLVWLEPGGTLPTTDDDGYPVGADPEPVGTPVAVLVRLKLGELSAVGPLELVAFETGNGGEEEGAEVDAEEGVEAGEEVGDVKMVDEKTMGGMGDAVEVKVIRCEDDVCDQDVGIGMMEALDDSPGPVGIGVIVVLDRIGPVVAVVFSAELDGTEPVADPVAEVSETGSGVDDELYRGDAVGATDEVLLIIDTDIEEIPVDDPVVNGEDDIENEVAGDDDRAMVGLDEPVGAVLLVLPLVGPAVNGAALLGVRDPLRLA